MTTWVGSQSGAVDVAVPVAQPLSLVLQHYVPTDKDDRCIGWQGGKVTAMATLCEYAEAFDAPCYTGVVKTPPTPESFQELLEEAADDVDIP